jgi:uncharacterized protein
MKNVIAFLLFALPLFVSAQTQSSKYDKALADSLGADEYGMKNYLFVILKTGKTVIEDKHVRDSLFKGHMDNIGRLAKMGKLVVAGPFGKNELTYRGLFIFNVKTREELHQLLDTDPTIKSGIFDLEILDWYGSAALPTYLPYHEKVQKTDF